MGMFSGALDNLLRQRFRTDESGHLVFLPYGSRKSGYYIEASDEYKIKSLVKIYAVAGVLINLMGYIASYSIAEALTFNNHSGTLASRVETGAVIYFVSALILLILPALVLWYVYKGVITGICSALPTVSPESIRQMARPQSQHRTVLALLWAGIIVIGVGLLLMVRYRP
jgi:hypothetical protein